ncbi:M23 family metallopeptidase [Actinomycetospora aeridis]|uniref:M23 family metallopeptidase n=1 Tax=Actinomycetospora aeridis TaxID=3129231 RepID=A0ABU8NDU8_9PSEU
MSPRRRPRPVTVPVLAAALAVLAVLAACAGPPSAGPAPSSAPSSAAVSPVAAAPAAPEPVLTPVVAEVPVAPVPVLGEDERTHLVYELALVNFTPSPATIEQVETVGPAGEVLGVLAGGDLAARLRPTGGEAYGPELAGGQHGMLFLHVALPPGTLAPPSLTHRLTARIGGAPVTETVAPTPVDARRLPVLAPPLAGEGVLAADGCCDAVRHTRAALPINGSPTLAQRYAIDYERVGPDGRIYAGPREDLRSYRIYGNEVFAVAEGTVVTTLDGQPEQVPGRYPEDIPITLADGNYVLLDVGNGFYVTYAHLQTGSVRVRPGDRVRAGDVVGLVGNTGNSVAPHLHLHVTDGPSSVGSQGLPYLIDEFTLTGRVASTTAFDRAEAEGVPVELTPGIAPTPFRDRMVLDQAIVTYRRP